MTRTLVFLLTLLLGACGGPKKAPPVPPRPPPAVVVKGIVTVEVDPADAAVDIDGTPRGSAADLQGSVTLSSGTHQIVIRKPGFEIWRGEVEVRDQTEKLQVKLVPTTK